MRVAYDLRPLGTGSGGRGIGRVVRRVAEGLLARGVQFTFLTWAGFRPPLLGAGGARWVEIPRPRPRVLGWLRDRLLLRGLFGRLAREVDLVHLTSPFELDLGWPVGPLAVPQVVTVYDLMPVTATALVLRGRHRLLAPLYRLRARDLGRADLLLAISQYTEGQLRSVLGQAPPIRVTPLAADPEFQVVEPATLEEYRRRAGLPARFILYVGGLNPNKNLAGLLLALEGDPAPPPLVVAGTARQEHARDLQGRFPRVPVHWVGSVPEDDLPLLYGAAEALVHPALEEGFGLTLLEAMGCGTPVACSRRASMPETAGGAALYFDPLDPADLRRQVRRLFDSPALQSRLRAEGLRRAGEFSWDRVADETLQAYRDAVRPR